MKDWDSYNLGFFFGPGLALGLESGAGGDLFNPFTLGGCLSVVLLGDGTSLTGNGVEDGVDKAASCDVVLTVGISSDSDCVFMTNFCRNVDGTLSRTIFCFFIGLSDRLMVIGVEGGIVMVVVDIETWCYKQVVASIKQRVDEFNRISRWRSKGLDLTLRQSISRLSCSLVNLKCRRFDITASSC